MVDEAFKIYVDQLRKGGHKEFKETFSTDFLDIHEKDLSFTDVVTVQGEAYIADSDLVLHFVIKASGVIPCSICNEPVPIKVEIKDFYHLEPLKNIKSGIFNVSEVVREAILLETPAFAECNKGKCPKRKEIKKYLKEPTKTANGKEGYRPFADLK